MLEGDSNHEKILQLKRDYIPGLGDCLDMVILGAGWQKDRAIELGG